MREKSLLSIILVFVFSIVGFCSNAAVVINGEVLWATVAAFIYIFPLFVDAVEDHSAMWIHNMTQYFINIISIVVGIVYVISILAYLALQIEDIGLPPTADPVFRYVLAFMPCVFTISKLYDLRVALCQQKNTAYAYCRKK